MSLIKDIPTPLPQSLHLSSELHVVSLDPPKYIPPRYVRPGGGFVPNFQLFEKGDVNGEKEQKFYTFLKVRVHNLEEAPPSCSAQPAVMSWHWFSCPMRGLGRPMVPSPCCRDKTGPTGAAKGPATFQSA